MSRASASHPDVLPLPTGAEAAAFDRAATESHGVPSGVLMENAGRSAAQVVQHLYPSGRVVGLVGAGDNGGDGRVLLRTLAAWGRDVVAVSVADRDPDGLAHGWALEERSDRELDDAEWDRLLDGALVVDGLLGTGIRGAPRERQARVIRRVNASGSRVVALDLPSGVDSATGAVPGEAVQAVLTLAFGAPKLGSLLHPGRARCGRVVALEMGFPPLDGLQAGAVALTAGWARSRLPVRATDTHKNAVGRLVVVAGGPGMAGAAVMAVRAGFRAGAGLVQVAAHLDNRTVLQRAVPEAIYLDPTDPEALTEAVERAGAVAAGPGMGTDAWARSLLERVLDAGEGVPTVLDADALNLVAAGGLPGPATLASGRPLLLTPHPGEMRRLLGRERDAAEGGDREGTAEAGDGPADRMELARSRARAWDCAVLLKGAPSLVATADESVAVHLGGSSDLAVAGMGDVLTGTCGALLAQGLGVREAAGVGLHLTGRAAVLAGRGAGLLPSDVVRWLPEALGEGPSAVSELPMPFILLDLAAPR